MKNLPLALLLERYRPQIGVFLVVVVVLGGGVLALISARSKPPEIHKIEGSSFDQAGEATASAAPSAVQEKIKIDVAGAVANPGVYEISEGARVEEALNAAGGLAGDADRDWVSRNLNLATKLSDGDKLYIPKVGETTHASPTDSAPPPPPSTGVVSGVGSSNASDCSRVNINTAPAGTLADCLSGIGTIKAQSIVKYREDHGGFKSIEEIKNVSGIAEGTFAKIKGQITVD